MGPCLGRTYNIIECMAPKRKNHTSGKCPFLNLFGIISIQIPEKMVIRWGHVCNILHY